MTCWKVACSSNVAGWTRSEVMDGCMLSSSGRGKKSAPSGDNHSTLVMPRGNASERSPMSCQAFDLSMMSTLRFGHCFTTDMRSRLEQKSMSTVIFWT